MTPLLPGTTAADGRALALGVLDPTAALTAAQASGLPP